MSTTWFKSLLLGTSVIGCLAATASAATRQTSLLDQGWRFKFNAGVANAQAVNAVDQDWALVSVPHSWNRVGYYLNDGAHLNTKDNENSSQGIGLYRLHFTAPATRKGQETWLQFDAASRLADVWLNGVKLGEHAGGFSRFRLNATAALHPGAGNVLAVQVDNSKPAPGSSTADILPVAGDFFVHGGLYRDVSLITTSMVHFDMLDFGGPGVYANSTQVSAAHADVAVRGRLTNDLIIPVTVSFNSALQDANGRMVAQQTSKLTLGAGQTLEVPQNLALTSPHLWQGVADPYLYRLVTELRSANGKSLDQITQNFGIRDIRIDPDHGLFLNGKHVDLHGVSRHQDSEGEGWALSAADEDRDMALIREIGANTIRSPHYQASQHFQDLADRFGLILWDEIPFISRFTLTPDQRQATKGLEADARQQLTELIRQNQNHASVAVWSISNEVDMGAGMAGVFGLGNHPPDPGPLLDELNQLAHQDDPTRPTTHANGQVSSDFTDVYGTNAYYGWYEGKPSDLGPKLDQVHLLHPRKAEAVSEYGAGGSIAVQTDNPLGGPNDPKGPIQPEGYQSYVLEGDWREIITRPYLWSSWVWNMFDFAAPRHEATAVDINTKGLVTYDRKTRKDAFYFFKANWSSAPVVYITGRRYIDRAYATNDVKVYSNAPATELWLNGVSLGTMKDCPLRVCVWPGVPLRPGADTLIARGAFATGNTQDSVTWKLADAALAHIWIDAGSLIGIATPVGRYGSDNYFSGGSAGNINKKPNTLVSATGPSPEATIDATDRPAVLASYREGRFAYHIPLENGHYTITLRFVDPAPGGVGQRVFDVAENGKLVLPGLDLFKAAGGSLKAIERQFDAVVTDQQVTLDFKPSLGEAIVSAIEIDRR